MNNNRKKNQDIVVYFILLLISIGLCSLTFIYKSNDEISASKSILFFLFPFVSGFSGKLLQSIIKRFLAGELADTLGNAFSKLGWGMAIFLFFFLLPEAVAANLASIGIPFLTVIFIIRSEILKHIRQYIIASTVVKAVLYLLQGIIIYFMAVALLPEGTLNIGIQVSVADMAFFGFLIFFVSTLLSLFELSGDEYLAAAGRWFGKMTPLKFLFGCALIFVSKDFRSIGDQMPQYFVYIEWFFLFVILLVLSIVLFNKIRQEAVLDPDEHLRKHLQEIVYNKESEAIELARHIDDYISKGELSNLLVSIISIARVSAISINMIGKMVNPLIYFKDMPVPLICTEKERMLIQKRAMEDRRKAVENIIIEVKKYGRKSNEY